MNTADILKEVVSKIDDMYLYKYYNEDEERDPEIPDVLDALYEHYNKILMHEENFSSCDNYISTRDKILSFIDRVEEERKEFYIVEEKNSHIIAVQPVNFKEFAVRKPYATDKNELAWIYTGETMILPVFTRIYASGNEDQFILHNDEESTHYYSYQPYSLIQFKNFVETDNYVGFEAIDEYFKKKREEGYITIFHNCSTCGEIFSITPSEQNWYANRELKLPKRCKMHRGCKASHLKEKSC